MLAPTIDDIAPLAVADALDEQLGIRDADELARFLDENDVDELEDAVGETAAANLVDEIEDLERDEQRRKSNRASISFQFTVDQQTVNKLHEHGLESAEDVAEYVRNNGGVDALQEIPGIGASRYESLAPAVESYMDRQDTDGDETPPPPPPASDDSESDDEPASLVEQFGEYRSEMPTKERKWIESLEEAGFSTIDDVAEMVRESGPDALCDVRGVGDAGRDAIVEYLKRSHDLDETDAQDDETDASDESADDESERADADDESTGDDSGGSEAVELPMADLDEIDADDPKPITGPFLRAARKERTDLSCADIGDGNVIEMHPGHWARIERGEAMTDEDNYRAVLDALPLDDDELEWFWDAFEIEKSAKSKGRGGSKVRKHAKVLADVVQYVPAETIRSHIERTEHTLEDWREAREALTGDDE